MGSVFSLQLQLLARRSAQREGGPPATGFRRLRNWLIERISDFDLIRIYLLAF
jgi:hypothetical protein